MSSIHCGGTKARATCDVPALFSTWRDGIRYAMIMHPTSVSPLLIRKD